RLLISWSSNASPHGGISLLSPTDAPPPLIVLKSRWSDSFAIREQSEKLRGLVGSAAPAGPSPRPDSPWHLAHWVSKLSRAAPRSAAKERPPLLIATAR